jgi:peptidoglycan/xylan/chitin deacetylase (PgdA/CDA1 family)
MRCRAVKRVLCLALCLLLALPAALAERAPESNGMDWQENDPWPFVVHHGDRSVPKVAVTMDDCYEFQWVEAAWKLVGQYGGAMTFYPVGDLLKEEKLQPGDRELWQAIADSSSEIGTHTHHHLKMTKLSDFNMALYSKYPQQVTDQLLGRHYPLRTLRPPFGSNNEALRRVLKIVGYSHVIHWEIASTDPEEVLSQVQNGSILLFHARKKDYVCLETVIPALAEAGYEMVTVSDLLGLPPLEEEEEIFLWNEHKAEYLRDL